MENSDFLIKLYNFRKIELLEPNDEVSQAYLKKSSSYLSSAKILLDEKKVEESVSMSYYSMYYSLLSLFFKIGIKSENHTASIILLKEVFGIDNSKILFAKKERIDKQYYVDFEINETDAENLIEIAEKFNSELLEMILKIKLNETETYREKFETLVSENKKNKESKELNISKIQDAEVQDAEVQDAEVQDVEIFNEKFLNTQIKSKTNDEDK